MAARQEKQDQQTRQPAQPQPVRSGEPQSKSPERGRALAPERRDQSMARAGGWEPLARLFDQFSRGWLGLTGGGWEGGWGLDVREEDDRVIVRAEAPGFEPSDFDIQVRGDQLVLRGTHRTEAAEEEGYREWRRQEFYRSVTLPTAINTDQVTATYKQGVLTVTLPRTEGGGGKRITVEG